MKKKKREKGGQTTVFGMNAKSAMSAQLIDQIRVATNSNYALGTERFRLEVEEALGRRVSAGKSGRPRSKVDAQ